MNLLKLLLLVSAMVISSTCAQARPQNCYDPRNEPAVIQIYGQSFASGVLPLLKTAYARHGVDPRLIYHRLVGEAGGVCPKSKLRGDPDCQNSSGAYGLFQFKGSFYKKPPHRSRIQALTKRSDLNSKRVAQIRYYVETYIPEFAASLPNGGCQKSWRSMNSLLKVTTLGWGSCGNLALARELKILGGRKASGSYNTEIIGSVPSIAERLGRKALPLCPGWDSVNGRTPGPQTGRASSVR